MTHTPAPVPLWEPSSDVLAAANLTAFMAERGFAGYDDLYRWSVTDRAAFWEAAIDRLGIVFDRPPDRAVDLDAGVERPHWLPGARLNVAASCFKWPGDRLAVVHRHDGSDHRVTYSELAGLAARVVGGLRRLGVGEGSRVAIAMPMTLEAVAAYLGIVAAGAAVVGIADSFAPHEISTRLRIADSDTVITQDRIHRAGKDLAMYEKVVAAGAGTTVVVDTGAGLRLRDGDVVWDAFLGDAEPLRPIPVDPDAICNVLFSSGTTGEPKAIPWTHTSPIKCAMDGHFHHDIKPGDVVAWPTNLGWMMGPWLIFASLINGAAFALYDDVPTGRGFGEFVTSAEVTVLGVVPSLVAAWRASGCMEGLDWSRIRLFSSTGEASNHDDMAYLMGLAGNKPVVEYCGGTEIAGGYITGTLLHPAVPATFTTPALGIDLRILDDERRPADEGEVFLVPPSIGMSTDLLNRDHHEVYYAGTPAPGGEVLRRHGDHMERLAGGYYRAHGRVDDTMNLGGIKVSSAEIERTVLVAAGVNEVAAVAAPPAGGGPSRLVVFAVPESGHDPDPEAWRAEMQEAIRRDLNPLFKIHEVVVVAELPRTASAKVMRRELRAGYTG